MLKYDALQRYLEKSREQKVTLSYDQIERILGSSLPASASAHRPWWSNGGHSHAQAWLKAGYEVASVDLGRSITFVARREPGETGSGGMRGSTDDFSGLRDRVRRLKKVDKNLCVEIERAITSVRDNPRGAAIALRRCLESAIRHIGGLRISSDSDLNSVISGLGADVPEVIITHMHLVRRIGNQAAHSSEELKSEDIWSSLNSMIQVLTWLEER